MLLFFFQLRGCERMHGEHGREVPRTAGAAAKYGSSGFSRHAFRRGPTSGPTFETLAFP